MPNTIFTAVDQAEQSLKSNKFVYTERVTGEGAKPVTFQALDQYLTGYATVATFLCNTQLVENALEQVSSELWDVYRKFPSNIRNKFTRALNNKTGVRVHFLEASL
ncbi:glutathionyl-hydroquinone reductase [Rhodanobacter sp. TND4EL1]